MTENPPHTPEATPSEEQAAASSKKHVIALSVEETEQLLALYHRAEASLREEQFDSLFGLIRAFHDRAKSLAKEDRDACAKKRGKDSPEYADAKRLHDIAGKASPYNYKKKLDTICSHYNLPKLGSIVGFVTDAALFGVHWADTYKVAGEHGMSPELMQEAFMTLCFALIMVPKLAESLRKATSGKETGMRSYAGLVINELLLAIGHGLKGEFIAAASRGVATAGAGPLGGEYAQGLGGDLALEERRNPHFLSNFRRQVWGYMESVGKSFAFEGSDVDQHNPFDDLPPRNMADDLTDWMEKAALGFAEAAGVSIHYMASNMVGGGKISSGEVRKGMLRIGEASQDVGNLLRSDQAEAIKASALAILVGLPSVGLMAESYKGLKKSLEEKGGVDIEIDIEKEVKEAVDDTALYAFKLGAGFTLMLSYLALGIPKVSDAFAHPQLHAETENIDARLQELMNHLVENHNEVASDVVRAMKHNTRIERLRIRSFEDMEPIVHMLFGMDLIPPEIAKEIEPHRVRVEVEQSSPDRGR